MKEIVKWYRKWCEEALPFIEDKLNKVNLNRVNFLLLFLKVDIMKKKNMILKNWFVILDKFSSK